MLVKKVGFIPSKSKRATKKPVLRVNGTLKLPKTALGLFLASDHCVTLFPSPYFARVYGFCFPLGLKSKIK